MPEPAVVRAVRSYREALLARDAAQMRDMAKRWLGVEKALEKKAAALATEIARKRAAGETVTRGAITQMQRYQELSAQARVELRKYVDWADADIKGEIGFYAETGAAHAVQATYLAMDDAGLRVSFNKLSSDAVQAMAAMVYEDAPLQQLLANTWGKSVMGMTDALVQAMAEGWNPRKTARAMMNGMTDGLDHALMVARTEQLRCYRMTSLAAYRESGVVSGYKRICAKQERTCLACLCMDGEHYELEAEFADHPSGRCSLCPELVTGYTPKWETGDQWFEGLSPDKQEEMMGSKRYAAWQDGVFSFKDLAKVTHSDTWGDGLRVATLAELGVTQDAA